LKREQTAEWAAFRDYDMQEMEEDMSNGIDFRSDIVSDPDPFGASDPGSVYKVQHKRTTAMQEM
jgi:hypothetical protein